MPTPPHIAPEDAQALQRLRAILGRHPRLAIAFSGGLDSTFLLAVAHQALGPNLIAITAMSPVYDDDDQAFAQDFTRGLGVQHRIIPGAPLDHPCFAQHPPDRCYLCKREVFGKALELARALGFFTLADATNVDDLGDYRPGAKAAEELGVISPLLEAGLGKDMIRRLSRALGLPGFDRPSQACLATRLPFGEPVTQAALERVKRLERAIRALGFRVVRARVQGELVRLEVGPDEIEKLLAPATRAAALSAGREAGFKRVAVDLAGYRPSGEPATAKTGGRR